MTKWSTFRDPLPAAEGIGLNQQASMSAESPSTLMQAAVFECKI
jgi:hypothetical protein